MIPECDDDEVVHLSGRRDAPLSFRARDERCGGVHENGGRIGHRRAQARVTPADVETHDSASRDGGEIRTVGEDISGAVVEAEQEATAERRQVLPCHQRRVEQIGQLAQIVMAREATRHGGGEDVPHPVVGDAREQSGRLDAVPQERLVPHSPDLDVAARGEVEIAPVVRGDLRERSPVRGPEPASGEPEPGEPTV